jgi:tetratricopeptide (TPR) repeat protein
VTQCLLLYKHKVSGEYEPYEYKSRDYDCLPRSLLAIDRYCRYEIDKKLLFNSIRYTTTLQSDYNAMILKIDQQLNTLYLKVKLIGALKGKSETKVKIRDECIQFFEQSPCTQLNRIMSHLYIHRAKDLDVARDYDSAIADYETAIALDRTVPTIHYHYCKSKQLHCLRRYEDCIKELDKCIESDPTKSHYYSQRAKEMHIIGRYEKAIADFTKAIFYSTSINAPKYYKYRANSNSKIDRIEEAISDINKSIEYNPEFHLAYVDKAWYYLQLGRCEEALECCDKSFQIQESAEGYNIRAYIFHSMNRNGEAFDSINKALELKPDASYIFHTKGEILYDLGKYDESIESCSRSIELDDRKPYAFYHRSLSYMAKNQMEEALRDAQQAHLLQNRNELIKQHLDSLLSRLNSQ